MATFLQRPRPDIDCTPPRTVRLFTAFKLLILLFVAGALVITVLITIEPPSLAPPPPDVLAGNIVLAGRGTAGSTVDVYGNGQRLGRTFVAGDGHWQIGVRFSAGTYELVAAAIGDGGQLISGDEGKANLNVVDIPTLETVLGEATGDANDAILSGQGTPLSTLRLLWNGAPLTTVVVGSAGDWEHRLQLPAPSENTFVAQVLNLSGVVLGASAPRTLSVVAEPVAQPLLIEGAAFANVRNDTQSDIVGGEATLHGYGEPGARVSLWYEGALAGSIMPVSGDGSWRLSSELYLPPGERSLTVRMENATGDYLDDGAATLRVPTIPTLTHSGGATDGDDVLLEGAAEPRASLTLFVDDVASAGVTVGSDGLWQHVVRLDAGRHDIVARSGDGLQSNRAILHVSLARPEIVDQRHDADGQPLPGFYGRGRPQTQLALLVGEEVVGRTLVNRAGRWSCACTLPPGTHTVIVREEAEPLRQSDVFTLTVVNRLEPYEPGIAAPGAPPFRCPEPSPTGVVEGDTYVVGCGETLSGIALSLGVTVEDMLAYNPQISEPPLIYFGQRLNVAAGVACDDDLASP